MPAPGDGLGSGIKPPGEPVYVTPGNNESEKYCASNVTSPDPVIPTLTVKPSVEDVEKLFRVKKPNDCSCVVRPRQSNVTPLIPVVKRTPFWRPKVLASVPSIEPFWSKSMVTLNLVSLIVSMVAVLCRRTASARALSTYAANSRAEFINRTWSRARVIPTIAKPATIMATAIVMSS